MALRRDGAEWRGRRKVYEECIARCRFDRKQIRGEQSQLDPEQLRSNQTAAGQSVRNDSGEQGCLSLI